MPRVHVSLPLSGPAGPLGRDVLLGAELALERAGSPAELVVTDTFGPHVDRDGLARDTARRAVADEACVAYLGDFHSSQVQATQPFLAAADLLQVAPVATYSELDGPTLVRLTPHDGVGAAAMADWLVAAGVRELVVVFDHDDEYGRPVGAMCVAAATARGIAVRSRAVWDHDEPWRDDLGAADAFLYVGVAGSGAVGLWHDLHAANPDLWLLGSEAVAAPWLAAELTPTEAARTRFFVSHRAPWGFYGYAAMEHVLAAIAAGGGDRAATARAGRATHERRSVLGPYALDDHGHTTSTAYGRLTVADGELVPDRTG